MDSSPPMVRTPTAESSVVALALSHPASTTTAPASIMSCVMATVISVVKLPPSKATSRASDVIVGQFARALTVSTRTVGSPPAPVQAVMKNGTGSSQFEPLTVNVTSPSTAGTLDGSIAIWGRCPSAATGVPHSSPTRATTPASTNSLLSFIARLSRYDTPTGGDHSAPESARPGFGGTGSGNSRQRWSRRRDCRDPHSRSSCLPALAPLNRRRNVAGMFSNPSWMSTR